MALWIVCTEGQTFDMARCAGSFEFLQISAAIPNLAGNGCTVKVRPR